MNAWVNTHIFGFDPSFLQGVQRDEWIAGKGILKKMRSRLIVMQVFFVIVFGVIIGRMTQLTLMQSFIETEVTAASQQAVLDANASRADIVDRNGRLLATSLKTLSLYADPKMILDPAEAARKLSRTFPDLNYQETVNKLSGKKRFVWLKRHLTPKQVYNANRLGIPGVDFLSEKKRMYPYGSSTAHVIGYADIDNKGLSGLERGLDDVLHNDSNTVQTTLDIRLQHIMHRELSHAMKNFSAIGAAGLVMDIKTGEVLAMVSLPDFDPYNPDKGPKEHRFNRITLGAYEMGSTFKIFTTAALLEKTDTPVTQAFDARHPLRRAGFTINDFHPENRVLNVAEVFIHSSNIGTVLMAEKIGTPSFKDFFKELGLLDKPNFEIKETAQPMIPQPWRDISTVTASYGHGIAVTPLQLVAATATVTNGGYYVTPTLMKHPDDLADTPSGRRVLSEETSRRVRDLMRLVVAEGTGSKANIAGYRVGGKTGTAEKTLGGGYSTNAQIASFIGVFPVDAPRYVVLAMVDEPKGTKATYGYATGGWVSAPIVGNVIREMAPLVNIRPQIDTRLQTIKVEAGIAPPLMIPAAGGGRLASY